MSVQLARGSCACELRLHIHRREQDSPTRMNMERRATGLVRAPEKAIFTEDAERDGPRMSVDDGVRAALRVSPGERVGDMTDVDTLRGCLGRI